MAAPTGYTLLGIVGYSPKGDYDATETYNRYDTVYYNDSTYYAKHDNITGVTPVAGNDWGFVCQGTTHDMQGATSSTAGTHGLVPAPSAGDENKVLKGDGTWGEADALKDTHTVTGNPLSFTTESAQVASKTVITLEPIQAGSGDPSPSNIRAISGYNNINISVNNSTQVSLTLNDTIYGGTLDVESGELVVDKKLITGLNTLTWNFSSTGNVFYTYLNSEGFLYSSDATPVCSNYKGIAPVGGNAAMREAGDLTCAWHTGTNHRFYIVDDRFDNSTINDFKSSLSDVQLVFPITPLTYHLTPHQVSLLLGANTVTTNGTSISLTYRDGEIAGLSDLEGVKDSVEGLGVSKYSHEEANVLGAKNLIPYPYNETTKTENGITFTDNGDGTITANGTATARTIFNLHTRIMSGNCLLKNGSYILSGCPSGGSDNTFYMYCTRTNKSSSEETYGKEYGDELYFTVNGGLYYDDKAPVLITICIISGTTISNLTFKPMIRLASDPDDTWVPYAMTNRELTEEASTITDTIERKFNGFRQSSGSGSFSNTNCPYTYLSSLLDSNVNSNISTLTNGSILSLTGAGTAFEGILFKHSDIYYGGILASYGIINGLIKFTRNNNGFYITYLEVTN